MQSVFVNDKKKKTFRDVVLLTFNFNTYYHHEKLVLIKNILENKESADINYLNENKDRNIYINYI